MGYVVSKEVAHSLVSPLAVTPGWASVKDVTTLPAGGPIDLSLWVLDDAGGYVGPLPDATSIDLSPVVNAPGGVRVNYPASGHNFALLHGMITDDRDVEVAIWVGGREEGSLRAVLNESSGDEVDETAIWEFSGFFLEGRMVEAIVAPNPADEKRETHFAGLTAGGVMAQLMAAAHTRGALADIEHGSFTSFVGSNGVPFTKTASLTLSPGTDYLKVLDALVGVGLCEWEITHDHQLRIYEPETRGVDRTLQYPPIVLRHGKDLTDSPRKHSVRESATTLLAAGKDGLYTGFATDASALARRGRRIEVYDSQGNIDDAGALTAYQQAVLGQRVLGTMELSQGLAFAPGGPLPLADYDRFDWVWSSTGSGNERLRVVQWTISQNEHGQLSGGTVLNDVIADRHAKLAKRLAALESGSVVIGTSSPPPDEDLLAPAAPAGVVASSIAYQDLEHSQTYAAVTVVWSPVTTNTDGTVCDDLDGYRVQYRYLGLLQVQNTGPDGELLPLGEEGVGGWFNTGEVNASSTSHSFSGIEAGSSVEVQVAAFDRNQPPNFSPWSIGFTFTADQDAIPPPVASAPLVTEGTGALLKVSWDGLTVDDVDMRVAAPDFSHVEVHLSTVSNFVPDAATYRDRLFGSGAAVITSGLLYEVGYFARLVAVDLAGNKAEPSGQDTATAHKLLGDDIFAGAVGEQHIAYAAVKGLHVDHGVLNSAHVGELNVNRLTSGTGYFDMLLAGRIRTGDTGARLEFDNYSFRQYNTAGELRTEFVAEDGDALITGTIRSAATGERWEMQPDGSLRLYPNAGSNYNAIINNGSEVVFHGQLDGFGRSGYIYMWSAGVALTMGAPGVEQTSRLSVARSNLDLRAPVIGYRADHQFATGDATEHRHVFLHTDTSGNDESHSILHFLNPYTTGTLISSPTNNIGLWFTNQENPDCIRVLHNDGNAGHLQASGFQTVSGANVKENITDLPFEGGALGVVRRAKSKMWELRHEKQRSAQPGVKLRRKKPGVPPESNKDDDFELVDAEWDTPPPSTRPPRKHVGPIADDIKAVAPELVSTMTHPNGGESTLGLNLGDMIGLLWAAVDVLADKVDALTDKFPDVPELPGRKPRPPNRSAGP